MSIERPIIRVAVCAMIDIAKQNSAAQDVPLVIGQPAALLFVDNDLDCIECNVYVFWSDPFVRHKNPSCSKLCGLAAWRPVPGAGEREPNRTTQPMKGVCESCS